MRPALSLALAPLLALAALLCLLQPAGAQPSDADRAKQWFLEHDRDHDGYITLEEVMGYEEKLFKRMDQEGAGRLREDQYCAGIPSTNSVELERCRCVPRASHGASDSTCACHPIGTMGFVTSGQTLECY